LLILDNGVCPSQQGKALFLSLKTRASVRARFQNRELPSMESRMSSDPKEQAGPKTRAAREKKRTLALFYCQNTPESDEAHRQALEKRYASTLKLFPIACSGRLDPLHLLKALEEFADAAYVVACPEGACRYFEGNLRARKRVERTAETISQIGLEKERVGLIANSKENPKPLATLAEEILDRTGLLRPSPVLHRPKRGRGTKEKKDDHSRKKTHG